MLTVSSRVPLFGKHHNIFICRSISRQFWAISTDSSTLEKRVNRSHPLVLVLKKKRKEKKNKSALDLFGTKETWTGHILEVTEKRDSRLIEIGKKKEGKKIDGIFRRCVISDILAFPWKKPRPRGRRGACERTTGMRWENGKDLFYALPRQIQRERTFLIKAGLGFLDNCFH